jgi:flagellar basal-body rod protein FlgG
MLVREVFDLVRGLYTAATGALVAEANVDTIANNLSNASTAGFKRTLMQIQSAAKTDLYRNQTDPGQLPNAYVPGVAAHQAIGQLGSGSYVYDTPTEFDQGALQTTGNPLDIALQGPGFLTVSTGPNQVAYTRAGSLDINAQGVLVTTRGEAVLDTQGNTIVVNPQNGPVTISKQGVITQAAASGTGQQSTQIAQLGITQFGNTNALRAAGGTNFVDAGANPTASTQTSVVQGSIESSNADVVRSMVDLIANQRWFEANIKMIQTQDSTTQAAITTVGHSSNN